MAQPDVMYCPGCQSNVETKNYDAHVKSDHQDFKVAQKWEPVGGPTIDKKRSGAQELGVMFHAYRKGTLIVFIFGMGTAYIMLSTASEVGLIGVVSTFAGVAAFLGSLFGSKVRQALKK